MKTLFQNHDQHAPLFARAAKALQAKEEQCRGYIQHRDGPGSPPRPIQPSPLSNDIRQNLALVSDAVDNDLSAIKFEGIHLDAIIQDLEKLFAIAETVSFNEDVKMSPTVSSLIANFDLPAQFEKIAEVIESMKTFLLTMETNYKVSAICSNLGFDVVRTLVNHRVLAITEPVRKGFRQFLADLSSCIRETAESGSPKTVPQCPNFSRLYSNLVCLNRQFWESDENVDRNDLFAIVTLADNIEKIPVDRF